MAKPKTARKTMSKTWLSLYVDASLIAVIDALAAEHRGRTGHSTCRSDIARGILIAGLAGQRAASATK